MPFLSTSILRTEGVERKEKKVILAIPGTVNLGICITSNKCINSARDLANFGTV